MKKRVTLLALMLVAVMSISAQSLIGTWKTAPTKDKDGDITSWCFIFGQGTQFTLKMTMETSDKEVGDIVFGLTMPGTYKKSGNSVSIKVDPNKSKGKIEKMNFTGEMATLVNESPEMKKTVMDMLQKQVDTELTKSFADQLPFDGDLEIIKLTSTQLDLKSDDEVMKFTRVK